MKTNIGIITLLILSSINIPASCQWTGSQSMDITVTYDNNAYANNPCLCVDSESVIHLVWSEDHPLGSPDEILYCKSLRFGCEWPCLVSDGQLISYDDDENIVGKPAIAMYGSEDIFVVWSEFDEASGYYEIMISFSTDGGATWPSSLSADAIVSSSAEGRSCFNPSVATSPAGVYVVYSKKQYHSPTSEIYFSRSTDSGDTWSATTQGDMIISSFAGQYHADDPSIVVDSDDNLYVAYISHSSDVGASSIQRINISKSSDYGITWSAVANEVAVSTDFRSIGSVDVCVTSDNSIHVLWSGNNNLFPPFNYQIFYSKSTDGGITWTGQTTNTLVSYNQTPFISARNVNVSSDMNGNICAVWDEKTKVGSTLSSEIMNSISTDGGSTWSGESVDDVVSYPDPGNVKNAYTPDVVSIGNNTWLVIWSEFEKAHQVTSNNYELYVSASGFLCDSVSCKYECDPTIGILPFSTIMSISNTNEYPYFTRVISSSVNVTLPNGSQIPNWKSGYGNYQAFETKLTSWNQAIPDLPSFVGDSLYELVSVDVTPAPYNQPPYLSSGDMCSDSCNIVGLPPPPSND